MTGRFVIGHDWVWDIRRARVGRIYIVALTTPTEDSTCAILFLTNSMPVPLLNENSCHKWKNSHFV